MSPKILIVDDEPDILELVQIRLEMAGYETLTAESGEVSLKCFFTERPDLALLDLEIPGVDGFELCGQMCGTVRGKRSRSPRGTPDGGEFPEAFIELGIHFE